MLKNKLQLNFIQNTKFLFQKFENFVCKLSAILSMSQFVSSKELHALGSHKQPYKKSFGSTHGKCEKLRIFLFPGGEAARLVLVGPCYENRDLLSRPKGNSKVLFRPNFFKIGRLLGSQFVTHSHALLLLSGSVMWPVVEGQPHKYYRQQNRSTQEKNIFENTTVVFGSLSSWPCQSREWHF